MLRKIIKIDEERCNGCGLCAKACHEGAIIMVDGKAKLLRDDYCDGLGACLPSCPTDALSFEEREAAAFDEAAVLAHQKQQKVEDLPCGCPGTHAKEMKRGEETITKEKEYSTPTSQLRQWPIQIKLVPINAPYFNNANLLIAADCTAYAYADFHNQFMKNKITLIGCPKLDEGEYSEKLTAIIKNNAIKSVTVLRMEVPCCGGLEHATITALKNSDKFLPWQVVTISTDGKILD